VRNAIEVTRPGIEAGQNVTKRRSVTGSPTEGAGVARPAATFDCNECNEVLKVAAEAIQAVRRLAMVASNAILNSDLHRAMGALHDMQQAMATLQPSESRRRREGCWTAWLTASHRRHYHWHSEQLATQMSGGSPRATLFPSKPSVTTQLGLEQMPHHMPSFHALQLAAEFGRGHSG
jgi:hypothetical protein